MSIRLAQYIKAKTYGSNVTVYFIFQSTEKDTVIYYLANQYGYKKLNNFILVWAFGLVSKLCIHHALGLCCSDKLVLYKSWWFRVKLTRFKCEVNQWSESFQK